MDSSISVFIIEDNGINRLTLETVLQENGFIIKGSCSNAEEAWITLKNLEVDVILIDINLSGEKDGIWLANKINKELHIPFIYLTAYGDNETIKRVETTNPSGYLMKPYNIPTLLTTIKIAIKKNTNPSSKSLFIKDNYVRVKLNVDDILYLQSEGNYIKIHLATKTHLVRAKLSDFLKQLDTKYFIQVHRRFAINNRKIDMMGNGFVMINTTEIPVSKSYKESLENSLQNL